MLFYIFNFSLANFCHQLMQLKENTSNYFFYLLFIYFFRFGYTILVIVCILFYTLNVIFEYSSSQHFRVMKALGENGVPMPNLLALCEDDRYIITLLLLFLFYSVKLLSK